MKWILTLLSLSQRLLPLFWSKCSEAAHVLAGGRSGQEGYISDVIQAALTRAVQRSRGLLYGLLCVFRAQC